MYAIEILQFDPTTHKWGWQALQVNGLCSRPQKYNSREKAERVAAVCFPPKYAVKSRVVEVADDDPGEDNG